MSGLEGLAALGLACSIFQVISFGRETLDLVKSVYEKGTLDNSLMDKITAIQGVASNIIEVNIPQSGNQEKKLIEVTKKCTGVARDLQEEISFLVGQNGQGSLRKTVEIAAKANWRKRRLERMGKALSDAEQLMQTTLLAWIFKSANTASININSLGDELRKFVEKYDQGLIKASQLVSSEALKGREDAVRQSRETEEALRAHVTQTSAKFEKKFEHQTKQLRGERLQERLLRSLKYHGMNERANQVQEAHTRTFDWLFADMDDSTHCGKEGSCIRRYFADSKDSIDSDSSVELEPEPPEMVWSSFTDWLQSDLSIYWIMGKPGSGKSTLAKFILSEPRTKIALRKWRPGAIIASHYFWRPGALLQRSIKGMLCSLLHQLVLSLPYAFEYTADNVIRVDQKDAETDWSVPELQNLCLGLIRHCGKPLCLFIDGLDECGPEDSHQKLLEILETIRLPNVKIIVSSRNEPVFEKRFRHEPQLRVQDLTVEDLYTYASDSLPQDIGHGACETLVKKAEGVFLWLVLAIQSINRGSSKGEPLDDIRRRIESLPKALDNLFKDMWERLDDDRDLYRESAALYFKLKMAADDKKLKCLKDGWTILEMMLASFAKDRWSLTERPVISASQLAKECVEFQKRVEVRCAGLLVLQRKSVFVPVKKPLGDPERTLVEYADPSVGFTFIHRSVHDFLVDTVEGQNILDYGGMSPEDINIRIVSGSLGAAGLHRLILGKIVVTLPKSPKIYLEDLSSISDVRHNSDVGDLVSLCYKLYSSSDLMSIRWDERPTRIAAFFGDAACYPRLKQYYTSIIEKQLVGRSIRSAILLSVARNPRGEFRLKLVGWLLNLPNIDVNLKCPLLVSRKEMAHCAFEELGPLDHINASPFTRLLGFGLENLVWNPMKSTERYNIRRRWHSVTQFLRLVSDFASRGADFRSTLLIAFHPDHQLDSTQFHPLRLFQVPGRNLSSWSGMGCNDGKFLCVVALQATSVIQRMLVSLPKIGPDNNNNENGHSTNEDGCNSEEDEDSAADLDKAMLFLSQRCQEPSCGAKDRVIGFLQRCDGLADMPYRQVSEQDSASLMAMIWACIFDDGSRDLGIRCREVIARSPFSSIGFRDCVREIGCFDELAARKLLEEYQQGTALRPTPKLSKFWP